ncbi:hypothetical protein D6777_04090 [Candidatus Woesearchaeota archaeon]|nr:MAG: hypothetical protein D6777_04090 [Candidatus Woesearchaeota archaeon]
MKTKIFIILLLLLMHVAFAHGDLNKAQEIIDKNLPYNNLTDEDFEILGDYYMELMAGDRHDEMDEMMGGEGSESLRQMHIQMGKKYYYSLNNEQNQMMNSRRSEIMMMGTNGMMGYNMWQWNYFGAIIYFAIAAFIFSLIFWLTYRLIVEDKNAKKTK